MANTTRWTCCKCGRGYFTREANAEVGQDPAGHGDDGDWCQRCVDEANQPPAGFDDNSANERTNVRVVVPDPTDPEQPGKLARRAEVMRELSLVRGTGFDANNAEQLWCLATLAHQSHGLPSTMETPYDAFLAMWTGSELGLNASQSLRQMYIIDGRVSMWGDAPLALAYRSGLIVVPIEEVMEGNGDDLRWTCIVRRMENPDVPIGRTYTMDMAKRAGLAGKKNYRIAPERMIQLRARGWALRDACPEAMMGVYHAEELEGAQDEIGARLDAAVRDRFGKVVEDGA